MNGENLATIQALSDIQGYAHTKLALVPMKG